MMNELKLWHPGICVSLIRGGNIKSPSTSMPKIKEINIPIHIPFVEEILQYLLADTLRVR